ncbi:MAG: hypothetical protein LBE22_10355 [Azoarcus sp.]|jgi:hypothetical protein|nr:hypothetical protein [Azoarcus sp.]
MPSIRTVQLSFSGGVVSPEMSGRPDDAKYQSGLAKCVNFIVRPQGPVENRAGLRFVRPAKYNDRRAAMIPFTFSLTQTMAIEAGHQYFRFHTQAKTLLGSNGEPYEIASPYQEGDLMNLQYVQKEDVLTLVHQNYPPMELRRYGATDWRIEAIIFSPTILPPPAPTVQKLNQTGTQFEIAYAVTAATSDGYESVASVITKVNGNLFENGASNIISWQAVSGATQYFVYKMKAGLLGYIGQTNGELSIIDDNISPDMSMTPPIYENVFSGNGNYPRTTTYFEQRRAFASTKYRPQRIWMTKTGTESSLSFRRPMRDDDRISKEVAALHMSDILHMVPITSLVLLTSSAEYIVTSVNSDAITQTSFNVIPQAYEGSSEVRPIVVNNIILYSASRGGHVRELGYGGQANGWKNSDISLRASHLFEHDYISVMALSKAPIPVAFCVMVSGVMLGMTYIPEQQIAAWHVHETKGDFESLCVVAEEERDVTYVIVRREINGQTVRYVECLEDRMFNSLEDAFFVDSGLTYRGEPEDVFIGLDHLEGEEVSIIGDGKVFPRKIVTGGSVTIDYPASVVHIGLPYVSEIETLPIAAQIDHALGLGRTKNVNRVKLRTVRSSGIWAGPSADELVMYKQRTDEPMGSPPRIRTGEIDLLLSPSWGEHGRIVVQQRDPLPLTLSNIVAEVSVGG